MDLAQHGSPKHTLSQILPWSLQCWPHIYLRKVSGGTGSHLLTLSGAFLWSINDGKSEMDHLGPSEAFLRPVKAARGLQNWLQTWPEQGSDHILTSMGQKTADFFICGFLYPWGIQECIPHKYRRTTCTIVAAWRTWKFTHLLEHALQTCSPAVPSSF